MMDRASRALERFDMRLVLGAMALFVALLAFEGWTLLLRKPYAEYQQLASSRTTLASTLSQQPDVAAELKRLSAELGQLTETLGRELRLPTANDKMAASLIEALDRSAAGQNVRLAGVKPLETRAVSVFEELSFDVEASGPYLQICRWMLGFGETLGGSATITDFAMKSMDEGRRVQLTLKLAVYRPQPGGPRK